MNWFIIAIGLFILFHIVMLAFDPKYRQLNKQKSRPWEVNRENLDKIIKESHAEGTSFRSHNNSCSAILNEDEEKLYVFYSIEQSSRLHVYKLQTIEFSDILSSEVIVDNSAVTSTARGSQALGAVVGGALLGGVGAAIGGLSGKTSSTENAKNIDIKLTLNDLSNPVCKINFLDGDDTLHYDEKYGFKKDSKEYKDAISEVEKWQGKFDVILKKQD